MLRKALVSLFLTASTLAATPLDPAEAPENKAAHHILMSELGEYASCSATAVKPPNGGPSHTLLTAAHCLMPDDNIQVDGRAAKIVNILYDHSDHALLILSGISFDVSLTINQSAPDYPYVRMWGNPGEALHIYRIGIFVKIVPIENDDESGMDDQSSSAGIDQSYYVYQLPVFAGDSGSGLIAEDKSEIVGVVFGGDKSAHAACFRLQFLPAQLAAIQ